MGGQQSHLLEGAYGWVMKPVTFLILVFAGQPCLKTFQGAYGWVMKPVTFLILMFAGQPDVPKLFKELMVG